MTPRGDANEASLSRGRRVRWMLAPVLASVNTVAVALSPSCGGSSGHEDLPSPTSMITEDAAPDASTESSDAAAADGGLSDPFDVAITYVDQVLPDVLGLDGPPQPAAGNDAGSAGSDAQVCPTGTSPCTAKCCGSNSVECWSSEGEVCTATEAIILNFDIDAGKLVQAPGADGGPALEPNPGPTLSCYGCLVNASCIDDLENSDVDNECDDMDSFDTMVHGGPILGVDGTDPVPLCLAVLECILAARDTSNYESALCGSESGTACLSNPGNGPCATLEVDGINDPAMSPAPTCLGTLATGNLTCTEGSPSQTLMDLPNSTYASGMANKLVSCGYTNCRTECGW